MLIEHHESDQQRITEALAANNLSEAGRLAHTLKGAAGNVGATRVQALAEAANAAIRQGIDQAEVERRCNALGAELSELIAAIQDVLMPPETAAADRQNS